MSIDAYIEKWTSQISERLQNFQETVSKEIHEIKSFRQAEIASTGTSRSELNKKLDNFLKDLEDYKEDEEDLQRFLESAFENNYNNLKNILKLEIISFQSKIDYLNAKDPQTSANLKKKYWKLSNKIYLELLEKRRKLATRQEITDNINIAKALYNVEELENAMYPHNRKYPQPFTDFETIVKLLESGQFKLVKLSHTEANQGTQAPNKDNFSFGSNQISTATEATSLSSPPSSFLPSSVTNSEVTEPFEMSQIKKRGRPAKRKLSEPSNVDKRKKTTVETTFKYTEPTIENTEPILEKKLSVQSNKSTQQVPSANIQSNLLEKANDTAAKAFSDLLGKNTQKDKSQKLKKNRSRMRPASNPVQALAGSGYFSIEFGEEYSNRGSRRGSKPLSYKE
ncbi:hypothetical protein ACO0RG_004368 [Hanseniaspora osmophila]